MDWARVFPSLTLPFIWAMTFFKAVLRVWSTSEDRAASSGMPAPCRVASWRVMTYTSSEEIRLNRLVENQVWEVDSAFTRLCFKDTGYLPPDRSLALAWDSLSASIIPFRFLPRRSRALYS